jgi:hypothetical protein
MKSTYLVPTPLKALTRFLQHKIGTLDIQNDEPSRDKDFHAIISLKPRVNGPHMDGDTLSPESP